jgi:hypothetical protein
MNAAFLRILEPYSDDEPPAAPLGVLIGEAMLYDVEGGPFLACQYSFLQPIIQRGSSARVLIVIRGVIRQFLAEFESDGVERA